ncbi:MAG: cyclic nucleotide-binding domain-containing protein [Planctomycetales bacterium]
MKRVLYILGLLQDKDIDWLAASGRREPVAPGTDIVVEGSPLDSLFIIIDGKFAIKKGETVVASVGSGEVVGEISMLDSRPPVATVSASEDGNVLRLTHGSLHAKLDIDPGFASRFYKALAIFLAQRMRERDALGFGDTRDLDEDVFASDEIDPDQLENLALAGARFTWLLDRLRSN